MQGLPTKFHHFGVFSILILCAWVFSHCGNNLTYNKDQDFNSKAFVDSADLSDTVNEDPIQEPSFNPAPSPTPTPTPTPAPEVMLCGMDTGFKLLDLNNNPITELVTIDNIDTNRTVQAKITVPESGRYKIYNFGAESGAGQLNESSYLRVMNSMNATGLPIPNAALDSPNCDSDGDGKTDDLVVVDNDNVEKPTSPVYFGTFDFLSTEDNVIELSHLCPLVRLNLCANLHNNNSGASDCQVNMSTVNSVHFGIGTLCVIKTQVQ